MSGILNKIISGTCTCGERIYMSLYGKVYDIKELRIPEYEEANGMKHLDFRYIEFKAFGEYSITGEYTLYNDIEQEAIEVVDSRVPKFSHDLSDALLDSYDYMTSIE